MVWQKYKVPRPDPLWDKFDQSKFTYGSRDRSDYIYNRWLPGSGNDAT